jgi:hypothetical protein
MSEHDASAAVPTSASGDPVVKDLLHNLLIVRYPYVFGDGEDPETFDAVDAETGSIPLALVFEQGLFTLDEDDTTTAHDGVTCLVTNDGKRYKRETVDFDIKSVLDKDETDPPEDASLGARYLVPAGASGDWGTHPEDIAIFTARGWVYIEPKIGQLLYIEDEDKFYHYGVSGDWTEGIGQSALADSSVRSNHLLGGRTHWVIINQTTNAPPGSPTIGQAYIVGGAPTGDWSGHTGKIAIWNGVSWSIYSPAEGWLAYDQATDTPYVFSTTWVSASGAWTRLKIELTPGTGSTTAATGTSAWNGSGTPTTSMRFLLDAVTITHKALSGKYLRISYRAQIDAFSSQPNINEAWTFGIAIFRDSDANAIAFRKLNPSRVFDNGGATLYYIPGSVEAEFIVQTGDAASHVYKAAILSARSGTTNWDVTTISRREFTLEEAF